MTLVAALKKICNVNRSCWQLCNNVRLSNGFFNGLFSLRTREWTLYPSVYLKHSPLWLCIVLTRYRLCQLPEIKSWWGNNTFLNQLKIFTSVECKLLPCSSVSLMAATGLNIRYLEPLCTDHRLKALLQSIYHFI